MTTTTLNPAANRNPADERDDGLPVRVTVAWTVTGAVLMGGVFVAVMTLAERLNGNALLVTAGGLYILGALAGFAAGALLGFFGRPAGVTARDAAHRLGFAALLAVPALAVGFVAAGWIAMTVVALYTGKAVALAAVAVGWLAGAVFVLGAVVEGWTALHEVVARLRPAAAGFRPVTAR
jgi:hypothetical protein